MADIPPRGRSGRSGKVRRPLRDQQHDHHAPDDEQRIACLLYTSFALDVGLRQRLVRLLAHLGVDGILPIAAVRRAPGRSGKVTRHLLLRLGRRRTAAQQLRDHAFEVVDVPRMSNRIL